MTCRPTHTCALDVPTQDAVIVARDARDKAKLAAEQAHEATVRAARMLAAAGLTYREIAPLLGLSHQRVGHILKGNPP